MTKKDNQKDWESEGTAGIVELISYSIAVAIFVAILLGFTDAIFWLFNKSFPSLKDQALGCAIAYAISFMINLPIMFTLGKKY